MQESTTDVRKEEYIRWVESKIASNLPDLSDSTFNKIAGEIGLSSRSIFEESDPLKIRLCVSELVIKRRYCSSVDLEEYLALIQRLVTYAAYLEVNKPASCVLLSDVKPMLRQNVALKDNVIQAPAAEPDVESDLADPLTVAYYLSRMNLAGVKELGYSNFTEAFESLGEILGRKPATIKNMRDEFDPYFNNGRVGWNQRKLRSSRQVIFDKLSDESDHDLTQRVKRIIASYAPESPVVKINKEHHTKISNESMKIVATKNFSSTKQNTEEGEYESTISLRQISASRHQRNKAGITESNKINDSLTIAYYLSRRSKEALKELRYKTYREAFDDLGRLLGQKPTTIRNMRDEFAPYFDNGRKGWYQRDLKLRKSRKAIFDLYANVSDFTLMLRVKDILDQYRVKVNQPVTKTNNKHTIKLSSDDMKVIRSKKK